MTVLKLHSNSDSAISYVLIYFIASLTVLSQLGLKTVSNVFFLSWVNQRFFFNSVSVVLCKGSLFIFKSSHVQWVRGLGVGRGDALKYS
jgi:hypothetical protein